MKKFSTPLSVTGRSSGKNIRRDLENLNNIINALISFGIYRTPYLIRVDYTYGCVFKCIRNIYQN